MAISQDLKNKLGIKTNVPKLDWFKYSGIIATPPKFGKTTLASIIPNSIMVECEIGMDSLSTDYYRVKSWEDWIGLIDTLEENIDEIGEDIKLIIIDTIHELWSMSDAYTLKKINSKQRAKGKDALETVSQYDFRNGLKLRDREFIKQRDRLKDMGFSILSMSHLVKKKIKPEDEESFYSLDLDYDENLYNILVKDASYILIGQNIKEKDEDGKVSVKRKFTSKNDGIIQGGSRVHFGQDIYFDNEQEFLDKFTAIFKETLLTKNNLNQKDGEKLLKSQDEEMIEQRKELKKDNNSKEDLISNIKKNMANKELDANIKKAAQNFMLEEFGDKSSASLSDRTAEELKKILSKFN